MAHLFSAAILITGAVLAVGTASPAAGQDRAQQEAWCLNNPKRFSADLVIGGCTALVQSGAYGAANMAILFTNRANAYDDQQNFSRAIADYSEAIRINPQHTRAFYNRGTARYAQNDYPRAIADYSEAIRIKPQDADAFNNRGVAYKAQKNYPRAIADYTEAIRLNPQHTFAFVNRGLVGLLQRRFQNAWNDYDAALRRQPADATALYGRGVAARRLGRTTEGDQDMARAVALDPKVAGGFAEIRLQ